MIAIVVVSAALVALWISSTVKTAKRTSFEISHITDHK